MTLFQWVLAIAGAACAAGGIYCLDESGACWKELAKVRREQAQVPFETFSNWFLDDTAEDWSDEMYWWGRRGRILVILSLLILSTWIISVSGMRLY